MRGVFSPERYAEWRKTLPWTDEQIAAQFDRDADAIEGENEYLASRYRYRAKRIRSGRLSSYDLRTVMDGLIKVCAVCGKKALYRSGLSGLCSAHRMVKDVHAAARINRIEAKSTVIERAESARVRRERGTERAKKAMRFGGKGSR